MTIYYIDEITNASKFEAVLDIIQSNPEHNLILWESTDQDLIISIEPEQQYTKITSCPNSHFQKLTQLQITKMKHHCIPESVLITDKYGYTTVTSDALASGIWVKYFGLQTFNVSTSIFEDNLQLSDSIKVLGELSYALNSCKIENAKYIGTFLEIGIDKELKISNKISRTSENNKHTIYSIVLNKPLVEEFAYTTYTDTSVMKFIEMYEKNGYDHRLHVDKDYTIRRAFQLYPYKITLSTDEMKHYELVCTNNISSDPKINEIREIFEKLKFF